MFDVLVDLNGGLKATASSGRRSLEIRRGIGAETVGPTSAFGDRRRVSARAVGFAARGGGR